MVSINKIPAANRAFFCLSLRVGGIIVGFLEVIFCGMLIFLRGLLILLHGTGTQEHHFYVFMDMLLIVGMIMELVVTCSAVCLIIGALRVSLQYYLIF